MLDPLTALAIGAAVLGAALFLARLIPDRYDFSSDRARPPRR